ncbi:MAG: aminotransferase class I/II-fold pyridoxal phosphate-dependent enzyme [Bacillota bacterium]|nr:aminotransferase class I/II-fold pyridoxal phosphate-dependent enzyme [Bacillota bacterium]
MGTLSQKNAPLYEALCDYKRNRVVPFDVPGHKQGRGNPELTECLGKACLNVDVNSMKPLDNLCHPVSVIRDAEKLAAEAFSAGHAFFMVNGTSSAVQAMLMSALRKNDKIILPRNVHRSAINALILTGAIPVYINPGLNKKLGIPLGMSVSDVKEAIAANPDAKAILLNNPTYYGVCSNIKEIAAIAKKAGMLTLADEAHGTHFYFGDGLPLNAMAAGADMSAVSMHKTGGSLTQSSLLLLSKSMNHDYVRQVINLTQTTSASYLLMSSLDISRRNLAVNGKEIFEKVVDFAGYARGEINKIGGLYAFSKELIDGDAFFDFDVTKLSIHTRDIGLAGIEVYDILRDDYGIQIEFGDIGNILAIISVGDRRLDIERLIAALSEIKRIYQKDPSGMFDHEYISPEVLISPQEAFYSRRKLIPLIEAENSVCAEFVMCYPPGIPILAPGERIKAEILDYIEYAKKKGCFLTGTEDLTLKKINVIEEG